MLPLLLLPLDLLLEGQDVQVEVPGDDAAVAAVLGHPVLPATQLPRAVTVLPGEEIRNAAFNHRDWASVRHSSPGRHGYPRLWVEVCWSVSGLELVTWF